jgi:hypothetical protein
LALPSAWHATRRALSDLLEADNPWLRDDAALRARVLRPIADVRLHLPLFVRSFTGFYASREHATNVGKLFRDPANALLPNWLHIPIGYNGRASTVVVSGSTQPPGAEQPVFAPCRKLDLELELGAFVGVPSAIGEPVSLAEAEAMIFGYVLLNPTRKLSRDHDGRTRGAVDRIDRCHRAGEAIRGILNTAFPALPRVMCEPATVHRQGQTVKLHRGVRAEERGGRADPLLPSPKSGSSRIRVASHSILKQESEGWSSQALPLGREPLPPTIRVRITPVP